MLDLRGLSLNGSRIYKGRTHHNYKNVSMVEAKSDCKVIEEILEGRKKVDLVLVHHVKEERLVQMEAVNASVGRGQAE